MEIIIGDQTFVKNDKPKMKTVRTSAALVHRVNAMPGGMPTPELFDEMVDFLVELFDDQFTSADVMEKCDYDYGLGRIMDLMTMIATGMAETLREKNVNSPGVTVPARTPMA